jgi:sugar lactone lactonase YvrE
MVLQPRIFRSLALAVLLTSCQGQAPTTPRPKPKASTPVVTTAASPSPTAPAILASPPSGPSLAPTVAPSTAIGPADPVLANNGANVISDHGGGILGTVRAPAGLAARRLLALQEQGVGGIPVALQTADGKPVMGTTGRAIATTTRPDGTYVLPFSGNTHNMVVAATLPAGKGTVVAYVPKGVGDQPVTVDLDTASTYALGYILDQYVRVQAEPVAVLDKLPADVAADTRTKTAVALGSAAVPDALTLEKVVAAVEGLRRTTPAVNQQLEYVRTLLFAGLSNQGIGKPVLDVELDPQALAISPAGELHYSQPGTGRIYKKSQDGHLVAVAGNGAVFVAAGGKDTLENVPALEAPLAAYSFAFDKAGYLYALDPQRFRVRRVSPQGTVATYATLADGTFTSSMALGPDGKVWIAAKRGVYRVDAMGAKPELVAGEDLPGQLVVAPGTMSGDGGPPAAARFQAITSITVDPATNEPLVFDAGAIRRIGASQVTTIAGSATTGHADGQGAQARFGATGDLAVGPDGTIYVADTVKNYMRTVAKDGTVATIAGDGNLGSVVDGPASGHVGVPFAPLPQPDGSLYFVSAGTVRRLEKGTLTTIAGSNQIVTTPRKADAVQFEQPKALCYDATADAMYVADLRHLWRWDLAANTFQVWAGGGLVGEEFHEGIAMNTATTLLFSGLGLDPDGTLEYITKAAVDTRMHVIRQANGTGTTLFLGTNDGPDELSFANTSNGAALAAPFLRKVGDVRYYGAFVTNHVRRIEADGSTTPFLGYGSATADGTLAKDFKVTYPSCLEQGPDGQLYLGAYAGVFRIDLATTAVTRVFGSRNPTLEGAVTNGMKGGDVPLLLASGLAWDAQGRMLVSDPFRGQVMRLEADGTVKLVAGKNAPAWNGQGVDEGLGGPAGIAFDKRGDLFIADVSGAQIKRVPKASLP